MAQQQLNELPPALPVECWIFKRSRYLNQHRKRYFVMDVERGIIRTKKDKTKHAETTEIIRIKYYKPECSKELLEEMKQKHKAKHYFGAHGIFIMEPIDPSTHSMFYFSNQIKKGIMDVDYVKATPNCSGTYILSQGIKASILFKTIKEALNKKDYITARVELIKFPFLYIECIKLNYEQYDSSFDHLQKYFDFALNLIDDSDDNTFQIYALKEYCRFLGKSKYEQKGYSHFYEAKKIKQKRKTLYERILDVTNESDWEILGLYGQLLIGANFDCEKGIKCLLKSIQQSGGDENAENRRYWLAEGYFKQKKYMQSEKLLHDSIQKYGQNMNHILYKASHDLLEKIEKQKQILLQNKIIQNDMKLNFDTINIHQNEQQISDLPLSYNINYKQPQNEEKEDVSCVVFKEWLKNNNLTQYLDVFKAKKFMDIRLIPFIDQNSLKNDILANTSFDSQIHFNFLFTKINELKKDIVEFKEWLKMIEMDKYYNKLEKNGIITKQMMLKNEKCLNEKQIANLIGNNVDAEFLFQALKHQPAAQQNINQQQEGQQIQPQQQQNQPTNYI